MDGLTMLRVLFMVTWVLILIALVAGLWMMVRLSLKLDRDIADRQVFAHLLAAMARIQQGELTPMELPRREREPQETYMGMDGGLFAIGRALARRWR